MFNLNQAEIDIGSLKEKVLRYLLDEQEKLGLIKSQSEYDRQYEKLSETIKANKLTMELIEQKGRTDVKTFNDIIQQIYMDLLTTFEQMNAVSSTLDKHRKLNNSIISNIKTKLSTIEDAVTILEDKFTNVTGEHVYVENFRSTDSFETNPELYIDADGNSVSDSNRVGFDKYNECVVLPKLVSMNKLISVNGQKMATITINKQLGSGLINVKNPNNDISKAIDTDIESYWEETILADSPIKVELDAIKYYKVGFGAVCEAEVIFTTMVQINELSLKPFGQFPMEIIAIKAYQSDQPDDEEDKIIKGLDSTRTSLRDIEIVSPFKAEPRVQNQFIRDSITFNFPTMPVKRLRILLNQPHYIKNNFIYDKAENDKNDIWFNSSAKVDINLSTKNIGLYNDKLLRDRSWMLFNQAVNSNGKLDLEEILFPKNTKLVPVTKYEYNYGLYNIAINEVNYKTMGIYVSKAIKFDSNIASVEIVPDETIPAEGLYDAFDIKYYISTKSKPTKKEDWIDLNGSDRKIVDFRALLSSNAMNTNISKERFFGTKGATLELENTPYMDFNTMNPPTRITIIDDKGKLISEPTIKNVTDYHNTASSYKNFSNSPGAIEYYYHKNKIYFNTTLPKEYIIEVDYKHFINSIRVKAILERGANGNSGMTPVLNGYKLLFRTIL